MFLILKGYAQAGNTPLGNPLPYTAASLTLGEWLEYINTNTHLNYSYNPAALNGGKQVQTSKYTTLSELLNQLAVAYSFTYTIKNGKTLLLKPVVKKVKVLQSGATLYGSVSDKATGKPLAGAAIYIVALERKLSSDAGGRFETKIPFSSLHTEMYVSAQGYKPIRQSVNINNSSFISIQAQPVDNFTLVQQDVTASLATVPSVPASLQVRNIPFGARLEDPVIDTVSYGISAIPIAVSLWPGTQTNTYINTREVPAFSLNIGAGYNAGLRGFEAGILANMERNNVEGMQAAGFANIVHGAVKGMSAAGFMNYAGVDVNGMQAAGIVNIAKVGLRGMQAGGVYNQNGGDMEGVQAAGIANRTLGDVRGVQVAGVTNYAKSFKGAQIAGVANFVPGTAMGWQIAGVSNIILNRVAEPLSERIADSLFPEQYHTRSVSQIAGVLNYSPFDVNGVQIAGFSNVTRAKMTGFQASGFVNRANNTRGMQVAGFMNSTDTLHGMQLAGFVNHADTLHGVQVGVLNKSRANRGFQLGVINLSDSATGFAIGVVNLSRKGFYQIDAGFTGNQVYSASLRTYRKPIHWVYTFDYAAYDAQPKWYYGAGLGSIFPITRGGGLELSLTSLYKVPFQNKNLYQHWVSLSPGLNLKLVGGLRLTATADGNWYYHGKNSEPARVQLPEKNRSDIYKDVRSNLWLSWKAGLAFRF